MDAGAVAVFLPRAGLGTLYTAVEMALPFLSYWASSVSGSLHALTFECFSSQLEG